MAGTHDDTISISERLVLVVINIEHVGPHGGPEVVGSQAEQQLEDMGVEEVVETWSILSWGVVHAVRVVSTKSFFSFCDMLPDATMW